MGIGFAFLYILTRINVKLDNPLIPAAAYGVLPLVFGLLLGHELIQLLLNCAVNFIFGAIFFFILKAYEENVVIWSMAVILGLLIRLGLTYLL